VRSTVVAHATVAPAARYQRLRPAIGRDLTLETESVQLPLLLNAITLLEEARASRSRAEWIASAAAVERLGPRPLTLLELSLLQAFLT
jgi:hypothetical protein